MERVAYSPDEAAEMLGVSTVTVRRRMKDGTLRSTKVGNLRRIPVAAIDELLAASVASERAEQGLPPVVTDPHALAAVDAAIGGRQRIPKAS